MLRNFFTQFSHFRPFHFPSLYRYPRLSLSAPIAIRSYLPHFYPILSLSFIPPFSLSARDWIRDQEILSSHRDSFMISAPVIPSDGTVLTASHSDTPHIPAPERQNFAPHVDAFKFSLPLRSIQSNLQLLSSTLTNLTASTQAHARLHATLHTLTLTTTRLINTTTQVLNTFARSSAQCLDAHDLAQDLLNDGLPQLAATHLSSSIPAHTASLPIRARKLSDAFASAAATAGQTIGLAERVRAQQITRRDSLCEAVADEHARMQKAKQEMAEHSLSAREARTMYEVAESQERLARSRRDVLSGVRLASTIGSLCISQSHPTVAALAAAGATATTSLITTADKDLLRAREERAVQLHRADCCDARCVAARTVAAESFERIRHARREETVVDDAVEDIRRVETALRSLAATMIAAETFWKGLAEDHNDCVRNSFSDAKAAVSLIEHAAQKNDHERAVFVQSDRFETVWARATAWWTAVSNICDDAVVSVTDVRKGNYRLVVGEEGEDDSDNSNTCLSSFRTCSSTSDRLEFDRLDSRIMGTESSLLSRRNAVECSEISEDDDYRLGSLFRTLTGSSVHNSNRTAFGTTPSSVNETSLHVNVNKVGGY